MKIVDVKILKKFARVFHRLRNKPIKIIWMYTNILCSSHSEIFTPKNIYSKKIYLKELTESRALQIIFLIDATAGLS